MLLTKHRKTDTRQAADKEQLVCIINHWRSFDELGIASHYDGTPRIYPRDQFPYCDTVSYPYFDDFGQVAKRFHQVEGEPCEGGGEQSPIQVAIELLPQFGFSEREIREALNIAACSTTEIS